MRTPGRLEIQALALLAGVLLTSACAQFEVADRAVSYSLAVESATNRMLLLNAVRASKRYPMHFGAIRIVRGDVPVSGQLGITIPFGAGATDVFTLSPTVTSIRSGTSFDLSILNTQEFYRGILTPLPAGTLHYYLSQGWPEELLLHLFVRQFSFEEKQALKENLVKRIGEAFQRRCPPDSRDFLCQAARRTSLAGVNCSDVIQKADSENQPYVNAPWDTCGFLRFQGMMRKLRVLGLELTKAKEPTVTRVPAKVTTRKTNGTETVTEETVIGRLRILPDVRSS